ncbi:MAG: CdaR family protein [Anaerolineae bacterium]
MALRRILGTLGSIALSLILAVLVWVGATSAENPAVTGQYAGTVPIKLVNQPADTVIVTPLQSSVQVTITAPESLWETIRPTDFEAIVDISQVPVGQATNVKVTVRSLRPLVQLRSFTPESVTLQLDRYATRTVAVRANDVDEVPVGFVAHDPVVEPAVVTIGGPASAVERVQYASVDVWLRGSRETVARSLAPTPMDSNDAAVSGVSVTPSTVDVTVELTQRANFKGPVPIRVQMLGEVAPLYWVSNITVRPASVTLVGLPSVLEEIPEFLETEPVDISNATATVSQRVNLVLPAGVSVVPETAEDAASQTVEVVVEVSPMTGSRTMLQVPVSMQGLAPDLTATLSPETVDVYLSGPLAELQALTVEQIVATVNLVDLGAGDHRLTPTVIVPEGIVVNNLLPEAVVVQIVGPTPTPEPTAGPGDTEGG